MLKLLKTTGKSIRNLLPLMLIQKWKLLDDPELNKKVLVAVEAYNKNSSNQLSSSLWFQDLDLPSINFTITSLQASLITQNDHLANLAESSALMAWSVNPRMTKIENTQLTIQFDIAILKTDMVDIKPWSLKFFVPLKEKPSLPPLEVWKLLETHIVFDGAFGGDGDEDFVIGEGVVVSSSSLERLTKSCLGGMMASLIFLEGLDEEA
ncbi:hypothetical protein Tco_1184255 [Tanacetum coccineum]